MTLVICTQSPEWVAIASDRMLSRGGQEEDPAAIKLVLFYSDMVFGYTGSSYLMDQAGRWRPTDLWLVDVLTSVGKRSTFDAMVAIQKRANDSFERMRAHHPSWNNAKQAFIGAGWQRDPSNVASPVVPSFCIISNFHETMVRTRRTPIKTFQLWLDEIDDRMTRTRSVGYPRDKSEVNWFGDQLRRGMSADKDVFHVVRLMKMSIRQTANRLLAETPPNHSVGKDIMAAILPRKISSLDRILILNHITKSGVVYFNGLEAIQGFQNDQCPWFCRFPDKAGDSEVFEAPHIVCPGFTEHGFIGFGAPPELEERPRIGQDRSDKTVGPMFNPKLSRAKRGRGNKNR